MYPWPEWHKDILLLGWFAVVGVFFRGLLVRQAEAKRKWLANSLGVSQLYLYNSGRSALCVAIRALGIKSNGRVILSVFNCNAVIDAVLAAGATPVLVDCDRQGRLDLHQVEDALKAGAQAVIVTHIYGHTDRMDQIVALGKKYQAWVINDLAQSLPVLVKRGTHHIGDMVVGSFGAEKHLYVGGGGWLISPHKSVMNQLDLSYSHLPITSLFTVGQTFYSRIRYYCTFLFYGHWPRLADALSSLGIVNHFQQFKNPQAVVNAEKITVKKMSSFQLLRLVKKWSSFSVIKEKSSQNFTALQQSMGRYAHILVGHPQETMLYATVQVPRSQRSNLANRLAQYGIATVWNYLPLSHFPAYEKYVSRSYPTAESLWPEVLSIPFRYPLKKSEVVTVGTVVSAFCHDEL